MKYKFMPTTRYKRAYRRLSPSDKEAVRTVVRTLAAGQPLERKYKDHPLKGPLAGQRDCHIRYDLVLIYSIDDDQLILHGIDIGSHSDVF